MAKTDPAAGRFLVRRVDARRILGSIPARTFANLESDGILVPAKRGTRGKASLYDLEALVPAYVAYLQKQRPGVGDREARAERDRTLAALNTHRLKKESGELVPLKDVVHQGQTYTKAWSAKVLDLPRRAEQLGIVNGERRQLEGLCRELLEEIATWQVPDGGG